MPSAFFVLCVVSAFLMFSPRVFLLSMPLPPPCLAPFLYSLQSAIFSRFSHLFSFTCLLFFILLHASPRLRLPPCSFLSSRCFGVCFYCASWACSPCWLRSLVFLLPFGRRTRNTYIPPRLPPTERAKTFSDLIVGPRSTRKKNKKG